eukprot:351442-Chlamydomonas_euryale.AAC.9
MPHFRVARLGFHHFAFLWAGAAWIAWTGPNPIASATVWSIQRHVLVACCSGLIIHDSIVARPLAVAAMMAAFDQQGGYMPAAGLLQINTQPLNRPGPQPRRPKTPIFRALAEPDRHVPVTNEDQGWSADAR